MKDIPEYNFYTEEEMDNVQSMSEFINYDMKDHYPHLTLIDGSIDGTYAECLDTEGNKYAMHSGGRGDFYSHQITFELLS